MQAALLIMQMCSFVFYTKSVNKHLDKITIQINIHMYINFIHSFHYHRNDKEL